MRRIVSSLGLASALLAANASAQTPTQPLRAFPSAEGFGAFTQGGRGGRVIKVTNLADAGPGSLRAAIEAKGPRIIIFETGGTIELQSPLVIRSPFITVAGQTAPGGGITLKSHALLVSTSEVIVRFIRVRPGDISKTETDSISLTAGRNIIIDHCSASWSTDETLSVSQQMTQGERKLDLVTVQWSIVSESLDQSVHSKGAHGYGSLVRGSAGSRYSFHHNLWAHHRARLPRPGNFADAKLDPQGPVFDFTNNVFYNWGGDGSGYNVDETAISRYSFRANSYRQGASSKSALAFVESAPGAQAHFSGNFMNGASMETQAIVRLKRPLDGYFSATPFDYGALAAEPALQAEEKVLAKAGASLVRDTVDARVIASVRARTGQIINSQAEVGGWPELAKGSARPDQDGDGLPDAWEIQHKLNPNDASDAGLDPDQDGISHLEVWLNSLVR
ncbi:Pectate lyase [Caulobacteraceae bacterium]